MAFVFALALAFLCGIFYAQSKETSAVEGTVMDTEGNSLPGVEVTITSPNMIGGSKSTITDRSGKYRFGYIQPGTYSISAKLEGFTPQRKESVRLFVGQTMTVDFTLKIGKLEEEVSVIAKAPLIDVKDSQISTTKLDEKALNSLVYDSEMYIYKVIELAPGATPVYHGSSAFGGIARAGNSYVLDGIEIGNPAYGSTWSIPDSQAFQETNVLGLGAPAEYDGFTGVQMTMLAKSGGNTYDGMLQLYYNDYDWLEKNFDIKENPLYQKPQEHSYNDARFEIGGPIIFDKLWLYGTVKWLREGFLTGQGSRYHKDQPKYMVKLTFQASPSTRITALRHFDDWVYDYRYQSVYRPKEASSYEYSHSYVHNFTVFHSFSDRTYAEIKVGRLYDWSSYGGYAEPDPKKVPAHYDDNTGMYSKNYKLWNDYGDWRNTAVATISHHADNFIKGAHDFKFGVEFEQVACDSEYDYNGGFYYVDNVFSGGKFHNYAYQYHYSYGLTGTRVSFFAQDAWKISKNISINPGLRFGIYRGHVKTPEGTPFKTTAFAPRIGISWDIFGDHTTALKAHYGRYYDKLTTNKFSGASGGYDDWVMYEVMPDGKKVEIERSSYGAVPSVDKNIKIPGMDQFSFGIERELAKDMVAGVTFVWKKLKNFIARVNVGATYVLVPFNYKDDNGVQHSGSAYVKTSPSSKDQYVLANPVQGMADAIIKTPYRTYWGLFFTFEKRFSNRWMLSGSYALSNQKSTFSGNYANTDPNTIARNLWNGEPVGYLDHNVKIYGTVVLPFDFNLSPMITYRTGARWTKTIRASVKASPTYNIEKPGSNRLDDVFDSNLRLEKTFHVKSDLRIGVMVDLINVFNVGTRQSVQGLITSPNYLLVDSFNLGRELRVGLRVYF